MQVAHFKKIFIPLFFIFIVSCKNNSIDQIKGQVPKLILTADTTRGSFPLTVNFTGTFHGAIDTIKVNNLVCRLISGLPTRYGPVFHYPDTVLNRSYTISTTYPYYTGTYKASMVIQTTYQEFLSDTITITVEYPPGYYRWISACGLTSRSSWRNQPSMILHARNNQLLLDRTYHARTGFRRCGTSWPQLSSGPLGGKKNLGSLRKK
jgi:hypothetical protein